MTIVPRGKLADLDDMLSTFPCETVGDVLFAAADREVLDFLAQADDKVAQAWRQLVAWATLRQRQAGERIYGEALSGHPPTLTPPPFLPTNPPAPKAKAPSATTAL